MSEDCNQDCGSCMEDCADRTEQPVDFTGKLHELSSVKKVIGIVSGKGGVGKSLVTSLLAVAMNRRGHRTAILDADVTGSSIPKMFGVNERARSDELGLYPVRSKSGIEIMSMNLLLEKDTDPVIWRGPLIAGVVKQFWTDVIWHDIDFMFIDLPPGTGDVPLTVFQSIAVDGIVVVTSPQELVSMIVSKAVNMAEMMNIPIFGLVENMSYFHCPDNGKDYQIFGESHIEEIAKKHNLKVLAKLPIDPKIAAACDAGAVESIEGDWFDQTADSFEKTENNEVMEIAVTNEGSHEVMKIAVASEGDRVTEHFGHCENFNIYEAENNQIVRSESIPNPGHKPGFLPKFLNELGVNVIISGGMGGGAVDLFNEDNIEVVVGASGDAKAAAEAYLTGALASTGNVCHEHQHSD